MDRVAGGLSRCSDTNTVTDAADRDYAVPLFGALRADRPFRSTSSGYVGAASDGLTQLDANRTLTGPASAANGNVVQTAEVAATGPAGSRSRSATGRPPPRRSRPPAPRRGRRSR